MDRERIRQEVTLLQALHLFFSHRFSRHDFTLKQLILVVGTLKTDRWAIAVTSENEVVEHMAFTVSSAVSATLWGRWSKNLSVSRSGPYLTEPSTTANQTLFIRRISLRPDIVLGRKKWAPSFPPRTLMQRLYATIVDADESHK